MNENKEESQNLIKKIAIYGSIFIVAIFIIIFNQVFDEKNLKPNNENQNQTPTKIEENETLKKLSEINDKFYSMNIHLTLDDDAITLQYQKVDIIEVGTKKYHKEKIDYVKTKEAYYIMKDNNYIKTENFNNFDFDKTFIELTNIKKLLEYEGEYEESKNGINTTKKYTYSLKDAIKIYNDYNNTSLIMTGKGELEVIAHNKEENLEYIEIDITDLYNFIEKRDLSEVKYKIEIQAEKEEDPSWILEKLS
ncbi:MAG: hypothetical protein HFE04_03080 [Bacilli bacterium]|nr:hypothetical protein [Bacilli bacterium]